MRNANLRKDLKIQEIDKRVPKPYPKTSIVHRSTHPAQFIITIFMLTHINVDRNVVARMAFSVNTTHYHTIVYLY